MVTSMRSIFIKAAPGYEAREDGTIWSYVRDKGGKMLSPGPDQDGYVCVYLSTSSGRVKARVHRLMLESFVGPGPAGLETRHLNGNRADNRLENLRYGTRKENALDCVLHGTQPRGNNHGRAKLNVASVIQIRKLLNTKTNHEIALLFGVSKAAIRLIRTGENWAHLKPLSA